MKHSRFDVPVSMFTAGVLAAALVMAGCDSGSGTKPPKAGKKNADEAGVIAPIEFAERNGKEVYNASGIVPLGDSKFVFVENNSNDALLSLNLTPEGQAAGPIVRMPLNGLPIDAVDDIEDLALAEVNGRRVIFASPSLSVKAGSKKKGKDDSVRPSSLLRITVGDDGTLTTEALPNFREWFVANVPAIAPTAMNDPDYGGLNVEGLAWDPDRQALLFGIRTPVLSTGPILIPIKLKDVAGPWTAANLEAQQPILLKLEHATGDQGVRGMSRGRDGKGFLIMVANATSADEAPFVLYEWDGNQSGDVKKLPYTFAKKMKPEGVTVGTVGGKPAIVVVDDNGGFQVIWL